MSYVDRCSIAYMNLPVFHQQSCVVLPFDPHGQLWKKVRFGIKQWTANPFLGAKVTSIGEGCQVVGMP